MAQKQLRRKGSRAIGPGALFLWGAHQTTPFDTSDPSIVLLGDLTLALIVDEKLKVRAEALMSQKRFDATKIHTHTFGLHDLPTALGYAGEHIDDAIKVVVTVATPSWRGHPCPQTTIQFPEIAGVRVAGH
jgi:hypothetical protein